MPLETTSGITISPPQYKRDWVFPDRAFFSPSLPIPEQSHRLYGKGATGMLIVSPFDRSLTPYSGRELEKACIHEAGHAVAARLNGFSVPWVSVDPRFIADDRIAIANECANSRALCMAMPTLVIGPIIQKGRMETKQDRMHITNYVVEVMAGPYAEFHFSPANFNDRYRIADEKQARATVAAVHSCPKLAKVFFNDANRLVPKFVKANFETITRLASELGKCGTLHQDEIDAIIDPVVMAA